MIFIYTTFSSRKEAKKIGKELVQKKLAVCINIFPIDSIYCWQKKLVEDKEFAVIIKTKKINFKKIEKFILKNHSYTMPCILEIPVSRVTEKYLNWFNKNIKID